MIVFETTSYQKRTCILSITMSVDKHIVELLLRISFLGTRTYGVMEGHCDDVTAAYLLAFIERVCLLCSLFFSYAQELTYQIYRKRNF